MENLLSLGVFYESGYSDIIPADEESLLLHLIIYIHPPTFSQPHYRQVEGNVVMRLQPVNMVGSKG